MKVIKKGIVVEKLKNNKVIVLMPDGDILKVKTHRDFEIGEEIVFKEEIITKKVIDWHRVISFASSVTVGVFLFFVNVSPLTNSSAPPTPVSKIKEAQTVTEVFIESKSDVKLLVDNEDKDVVEAIPLNKSAKRVIKKLDWKNQSINEFIEDYFEGMKNEGYIGVEDKAVVSVTNGESKNKETMKHVKEAINDNDFIKENEIDIFTLPIPQKTLETAEELEVPPGKFVIGLLVAKNIGGNAPPLKSLKFVDVTGLVELNDKIEEILPTTTEKELEELTEEQSKNIIKEELENTDNQSISINQNENQEVPVKKANNYSSPSPKLKEKTKNESDSNKITQSEPKPTPEPEPKTEVQPISSEKQNNKETEGKIETNSTIEGSK